MAEAKYKNGKPEINPYDLPLVPCMIHPNFNDDHRFSEIMIAELEAVTSANTAAEWAIQMIAELQALWIDATDRLQRIEELAGNRRKD